MNHVGGSSLLGRFFKPFLVATLLAVLVYLLLVLYGDAGKIKDLLGSFKWHLFIAALALASSNYLLRFFKWSYYLRCLDIKLPLVESMVIFLSGFTVSMTPAKVGEVIKSLLLRESRGIAMARTAPIVVAERLTDMIAILILAMVGSVAYRFGGALVVVISLAVAIVVFIITVRRAGWWVVGILATIPFLRRYREKLFESYNFTYLIASWQRLAWPVALSLAAWLAECIAFFLIANGVSGQHFGLLSATFIFAFSTAAGAVAMVPGGLGVTEGGLAGLMLLLGGDAVTPAEATAATILTRVATLWFAVLIGIAALLIYIRLYSKPRGQH